MTPIRFDHAIRTERLVLRMMAEQDVDDIHSYQGRDDVCRYLLYEARTREQVVSNVGRHGKAVDLAKDGDYWQLALELPAAGRVIGDLYFTVKSAEHSGAEIGWVLHPDFHGHGYALEAATAMLDIAFGAMSLHRVTAELDPRNHSPVALCRRLGMREEARFRQDLRFRGEWADTGVWATLDSEWRLRPRR